MKGGGRGGESDGGEDKSSDWRKCGRWVRESCRQLCRGQSRKQGLDCLEFAVCTVQVLLVSASV